MYLYRHIQKWIYNSWSAFSKPCSDYPNTLTSSTANISPIQRNPLLNSVVADLDIRRRNQISKSASRLTLSSMTAVGATVVIPTKDQKNYSFVLRFPLFQSKLVFWYFRKEVIPVSTHEHRNFWSRIFLTRTYLFVNHKFKCGKNNATWLPSFWSWLLSRNWIFLCLPFRKSKSGYFVAIA